MAAAAAAPAPPDSCTVSGQNTDECEVELEAGVELHTAEPSLLCCCTVLRMVKYSTCETVLW